jgi:hypothetical protein
MQWRDTAPSSYSRSRKFRLRPIPNVVGRSEHSRHMFGPELVQPSKPQSMPKSPKLECASEFPSGSMPAHQRISASAHQRISASAHQRISASKQTKPIASDQFTFARTLRVDRWAGNSVKAECAAPPSGLYRHAGAPSVSGGTITASSSRSQSPSEHRIAKVRTA